MNIRSAAPNEKRKGRDEIPIHKGGSPFLSYFPRFPNRKVEIGSCGPVQESFYRTNSLYFRRFYFSWAELHDSELGGIHSAFSFIFIGRRRRRKPRCGSSSARTLVFGKFLSPD